MTPAVQQWNQGDRVRFALGGPDMLVKAILVHPEPGSPPHALCQWFSPDGYFHEALILPAFLVPVPPPPP